MSLQHVLPPRLYEIIDRAGIATTKQLITFSDWEIKKFTNLSLDDISLIKTIISDNVCPSIVTSNCLTKEKCYLSRISSGNHVLDMLLKGGLRRGTITEVFGESGCGKTQFSLQMAVNNWADGCVYICTEDLFPTKRFEQMKRSLPSFDHNIDYGKHIFVEHVTEASDLLSCISIRLPKLLTQTKLSLMVIDSIAAPFRCESTNYIKRAEELREIAVLLTSIAQKYNLAVLCTNQVTASFEEESNILPSLGLAWSNMITTRLKMVKTTKTVNMTSIPSDSVSEFIIRELSVMFAPDLPNSEIEFVITAVGLQTLGSRKHWNVKGE